MNEFQMFTIIAHVYIAASLIAIRTVDTLAALCFAVFFIILSVKAGNKEIKEMRRKLKSKLKE